jgi:hypothetical protein
LDEAEYIIDCDFLKHIINILIQNHSITVNKMDLDNILSYFGDVDVRTRKERIMEREVGESGCCGCSEKTRDKIIEVIQKVVLNGLSIAKHIPDLAEFLGSIGVSL